MRLTTRRSTRGLASRGPCAIAREARSVERGTAAFAAAALLLGCLAPEAPRDERRARLDRLLSSPPVLIVYETTSALAVQTVAGSLAFSSGFDEGAALRERLALTPPARGFAEAFVDELREQPRFATTAFRIAALPEVRDELATSGAQPVLYAHSAQWRLVYDLSLSRHRMVLELWATISPAADVAAGRGGMALPQRIWRGACTWRGPDPTLPLETWTADDGAVLRARIVEAQQSCGKRVAQRLVAFLERGDEQSPYDGGEL